MAFERKLECYKVESVPALDHHSIRMKLPELRRLCQEQGLALFYCSSDEIDMHFGILFNGIIYAMDEEEEGAA